MMNLMIYSQARCQTRIQTKLTNCIPICQIIRLFSRIKSTFDLRRPLLVDKLRASYVKFMISPPNISPLSARDLIFQFPLFDTWWCCVILITFCSGFILSAVFHCHILLKLNHYDLCHDVLAPDLTSISSILLLTSVNLVFNCNLANHYLIFPRD